MPEQFSPQALARVLRNVDREILKEAIEIADIWDMFNSFERSAMNELGEAFNFLSNVKTFGFAAVRRDVEALTRELISIEASISANPLTSIFGTLYVWILQIILEQSGIQEKVDSVLEKIEEFEAEPSGEPALRAEIARLRNIALGSLNVLIEITSDLNILSVTNVTNMCTFNTEDVWRGHQRRIEIVNTGVETAVDLLDGT